MGIQWNGWCAGGCWFTMAPTLSTCKPSACEQRAFCTLHLGKGRRPPLILGFTVSNYYRDCLLFFDPCPCPVSASGTDDTPSMALCLQNQIGGFFLKKSGKSFICEKYGDHPYEDFENSGYNPDMKKNKIP